MTTPAAWTDVCLEHPSSLNARSTRSATFLSESTAFLSSGTCSSAWLMLTFLPRTGGGISFAIRSTSAKRHVQRPPDILYRRPGRHSPESHDLANGIAPVELGHVFDHLCPAPDTKIDVDIRHRDAFGIQEPLEQEIMLYRVDIRDLQTVRDQRAGCRASSRSDGNIPIARESHEFPDDQKISRESHSAQ